MPTSEQTDPTILVIRIDALLRLVESGRLSIQQTISEFQRIKLQVERDQIQINEDISTAFQRLEHTLSTLQ